MGTFHRDQRRLFSIGLYSKLKFGQFLSRSGAVSTTFSDFLSGPDTNVTHRKINPEAPIRSPVGAVLLRSENRNGISGEAKPYRGDMFIA